MRIYKEDIVAEATINQWDALKAAGWSQNPIVKKPDAPAQESERVPETLQKRRKPVVRK